MKNEVHIWTGYGKRLKYVDARSVRRVNKYLSKMVRKIREDYGWKKQIVFYIDYPTGRKTMIIKEVEG